MKTFLAMPSLRSGQDVLWIRTDSPGITDQDVLARSLEDARVLLTFDKDFGELAWRSGVPASCKRLAKSPLSTPGLMERYA
jgi:predicted nuclease of predicted toxin-antitoxin system